MTTAMNDGRQADTERRRDRVAAAIRAAHHAGTPLTASAIARAAHVDRTFLYRHRDLLDVLRCAATGPTAQPVNGPAVTRASLQADLANAVARSARLAARVQQLEARLSKALGEEIWRSSGLSPAPDVAELVRSVTRLEQRNVELTRALEERQAAFDVDQDGPVVATFAGRVLIDADHPRGGNFGVGQGFDQPQHRTAAHGHAEDSRHAGTGPTGEREADRGQR